MPLHKILKILRKKSTFVLEDLLSGGFMINRIIVGIDGSEESLNAYKSACVVAGITGASVEALYVIDQRRVEIPYIYSNTFFDLSYEKIYIPPDEELVSFYKKLRKDMELFGKNCLDTVEKYECSASHAGRMAVGIPFESLLESTGKNDWLILGKHGENKKFHKSMIGSTAEEVIRKAKVPVCICPVPITSIHKIAAYYDGGPSAGQVKSFLNENFRKQGIEITFFYPESEEREVMEHAALKTFSKNGIPNLNYHKLNTGSDFLNEIEKENFDLIASGSHGKHKLTDYLLGSHAVHLVRNSKTPILIIK